MLFPQEFVAGDAFIPYLVGSLKGCLLAALPASTWRFTSAASASTFCLWDYYYPLAGYGCLGLLGKIRVRGIHHCGLALAEHRPAIYVVSEGIFAADFDLAFDGVGFTVAWVGARLEGEGEVIGGWVGKGIRDGEENGEDGE